MIIKKGHRVNRILTVYMVLMLVLQKIAIHIGEFEFSMAIFLFPLLLGQLWVYRRVSLSKKRFLLYLAMMIMTVPSVAANSSSMKYSSYLLFATLYFLLCFDMKLSDINREAISNAFIIILLVAAIIGILQFACQLIGMTYFDIFDIVPQSFKLSGFNTYYSISYGSKIMKSNGWIFLEPSFYSQFMALGIILVLNKGIVNRKTIISLILLGGGLISSFSGTGILLLVIAFIPVINKLKLRYRILVIAGVVVAFFVFSKSQFFYAISDRVFEFKVSESSSAIRFINPYIVAFDTQRHSLFFGSGAGTSDDLIYFFQVNHNAITKIMVEYGIFVLLPFIVFIMKAFLRNGISVFSVSVLLMFLFLSGNLLQPSILFLLYLAIDAEKRMPPKGKH